MGIEKILGIGIITVILSALMRSYRPEISPLISIGAVAIIFALISPRLKSVMVYFVDLSEKIGISSEHIIIVVKVIGVAYIAQIGAEICRDAGENAIGTKIEIAGKVIILTLSMPVIYNLLEVVGRIINLA